MHNSVFAIVDNVLRLIESKSEFMVSILKFVPNFFSYIFVIVLALLMQMLEGSIRLLFDSLGNFLFVFVSISIVPNAVRIRGQQVNCFV